MAQDVTRGSFKVEGLRQTAENLTQLSADIQLPLARQAMRAGLAVIWKALRASTYTSFNRIDGAINAGWGIAVGRQLSDHTLNGLITQDAQSIAGSTPAARMFRKHFKLKGRVLRKGDGRSVSLRQSAFWWRFLEFGTQPRRSTRKPKWYGKPGVKITKRRQRMIERFEASGSRGGISARTWVRPALDATAEGAVEGFRTELNARIEDQAKNLPR